MGLRLRRSSTRRLAALTMRLDTGTQGHLARSLRRGAPRSLRPSAATGPATAPRSIRSASAGRFAACGGSSGETHMTRSAGPSTTTIGEE